MAKKIKKFFNNKIVVENETINQMEFLRNGYKGIGV